MSERRVSSPSTTNALRAELSAICKSHLISENGLREIIERHGCAPNQPDIQSSDFFCEACYNEKVTDGIIRYLLEYFPGAASATVAYGQTPLHILCRNKNATLEITHRLIDEFPDALRQQDYNDELPLHDLCQNVNLDDTVALVILNLFVAKCPESVRHANYDGDLPIHLACSWGEKSPEFCRILIEAYPESVRSANDRGLLPFHWACFCGTVATAEYLYKIYPAAINMADERGFYPINYAVDGIDNDPETAIGMVRLLLDCYGSSLCQVSSIVSMLSCKKNLDDAAALEILKLLVEKCPESVRHADSDGDLPIHLACGLGGKSPEFCRTLIEAYPGSEQYANEGGALPFQRAC